MGNKAILEFDTFLIRKTKKNMPWLSGDVINFSKKKLKKLKFIFIDTHIFYWVGGCWGD